MSAEFDLEKYIESKVHAIRAYPMVNINLLVEQTTIEVFNKALELVEQAFERETNPDSWGTFAKPKVLEIINKLKSGGR